MGNAKSKENKEQLVSWKNKITTDLTNQIKNNMENINETITSQLNQSIQKIVSKNETKDKSDASIIQEQNFDKISIIGSENIKTGIRQTAKLTVTLEWIWKVMNKIDFKDELMKDMMDKVSQDNKMKSQLDWNLKSIQDAVWKFQNENAPAFGFNPNEIVKSITDSMAKGINSITGGNSWTNEKKEIKFENLSETTLKN